MGEDGHEQRLHAFEQRLKAHRPHPADLAATQLVHPEELYGKPSRPLGLKEQALLANWWGEICDCNEAEREWVELVERRSVPLTEVGATLAEAALSYDELVAGGVKKTTALELTSKKVSRRPRSGEHVVTAKTVRQVNAIIEHRNELVGDPAHPNLRQTATIPLTIEVDKRVPFRPATAKIVEHARARRKTERQLAPPKIEYPPEPEPLEDDPLDGPFDYQLYRAARLLGTRWGESCSVVHRLPPESMDDRRMA